MPSHGYDFDPTYGHTLDSLLEVPPPPVPEGFSSFWQDRHERARAIDPKPQIGAARATRSHWRVHDYSATSTDGVALRGWLLIPATGPVRRGFIVGHGYGGREAPDFHLPFPDAALLFPCSRGLGRSRSGDFPADPMRHVVHRITERDHYILGGCVEDLWTSATALLALIPEISGRLGYLGISFGGGIGALALPWDDRFRKAHLNVPSFGHQRLRLELPTFGSGAAVRRYFRRDPSIIDTLLFHDAAVAARHLRIPLHCACALFDPVVAPPGQFAIHNATNQPENLRPLIAGHHAYPGQADEEALLLQEIGTFFADL